MVAVCLLMSRQKVSAFLDLNMQQIFYIKRRVRLVIFSSVLCMHECRKEQMSYCCHRLLWCIGIGNGKQVPYSHYLIQIFKWKKKLCCVSVAPQCTQKKCQHLPVSVLLWNHDCREMFPLWRCTVFIALFQNTSFQRAASSRKVKWRWMQSGDSVQRLRGEMDCQSLYHSINNFNKKRVVLSHDLVLLCLKRLCLVRTAFPVQSWPLSKGDKWAPVWDGTIQSLCIYFVL